MTSITHVQPQTFIVSSPKPALDATLDELRETRQAWLVEAQACGWICSARMIARWLGGSFEIPNRSGWSGYRFQDGDIEITLYAGSGAHVPGTNRFADVSRLVVTVAGRMVCNFREVDGQPAGDENLFVPGAWLSTLRDHGNQAEERAENDRRSAEEFERRRLLKTLLIGENV